MLKNGLIISALALTIIACGGDGDSRKIPTGESVSEDINSSDSADNIKENIENSMGGDEINATDINNSINDANTSIPDLDTILKKGYFVDAPIEGVSYACGEIEGTTTNTGEFSCSEAPIEFTIGSYNLGTLEELTVDGMVYPQDLIEGIGRDNFDDERLVQMVQLLQSLDDDGDISDIIKMDSAAIDKINNFEGDTNSLGLLEIIDLAGKGIVDADKAIEHLRNNILDEETQNIVDGALDTDSLGEEGGVDNLLNNILGEN